jgi:hypothetical protein
MQYNFYKELTNRWNFNFDFLLSWKKICIQPFHLCVDTEWHEYIISFGLVFVRFTFRLDGWIDKENK